MSSSHFGLYSHKLGHCKIDDARLMRKAVNNEVRGEPRSMHNTMHNAMKENKKTTKDCVKRRNHDLWGHAFWPGLALACLIGPALPFFGGCAFIKAPETDPAPTKVPDVPVHPDKYKPAVVTDPLTIKPLTDDLTAVPNLIPDYYQLVTAETGDKLILQAYRLTPQGQPYIAPLDKPVKVKLGGIVSPARNEPGWAEATATTQRWLGGRRLKVDEDKKFPLDLDGRNIVQIVIKSEVNSKAPGGAVTKTEETRPFNQVLVRAGYAFVDLITPTSFDYKAWVVDEEYARGVRMESKQPGPPAGLWARGIYPYKALGRPGALRTAATVITGVPVGSGGTQVTKVTQSKQAVAKQTVTNGAVVKETVTTGKVTKETVIKKP